jgi:iron-sulfur cluster repair protein YtfE (RIC family)
LQNTTPAGEWKEGAMRPSEVRRTVLGEHAKLRGLLAEVQSLVSLVARGHRDAEDLLRERGRALHDFFCGHLDLEDRILVPALRQSDGWGEERARLVSEEHREQREIMSYILERLTDPQRPGILVARDLASLADRLAADMMHEEDAMLSDRVLRDDVIAIDAMTG